MKKIYSLALAALLPVICISCAQLNLLKKQNDAVDKNNTAFREQTKQNDSDLTLLHGKKQGFSYKNNKLLLGDTQDPTKQIFLIHNKSENPIILDFPEGHIGATAGLMQMIQANEWYAYLYIKDKDYRRVETKGGKPRYQRPLWVCQKGVPDYTRYPSCKNYLDIYMIQYDIKKLKMSHNALDYKVLQIVTHKKTAGWLTYISHPTIRKLLIKIHAEPSHPSK